MKLPKPSIKPRKLVMPQPPSKTVEITEVINIDYPFTIAQLITKVPKNISYDKVVISLSKDNYFDNGECVCSLEVSYSEIVDNKNYNKEYKIYKINLSKYNINLAKYKEKHTKYLKEKKEYEDALKIVKAWKGTKL